MNIQTMLQWFRDRKGKVTYSMVNRNGPSSYDCSSAVYYSLIAGGFLPVGTRIGNTDSLFNDLEKNGWSKLQPNAQGNYDAQAGDIFIWGRRGASGGAAGHTGAFLNADDVIHCNAYYNTIYVNNYDFLAQANGWPEVAFYRYTGASYTPPSIQGSPTDQVLEVGSTIRFDGSFTADDVQLIGGIWQVYTKALCKSGFTWDDNGIPAEPLIEVDVDGYRTTDQSLDIGSRYKIPGKFTILDLGEYADGWLALIEWNDLKFWVDVESATEISSSDAGTPVPGERPVGSNPPQTPPTGDPPSTPGIPEQAPDPEIPVTPETNHVPQPEVNDPKTDTSVPDYIPNTKEDAPMAFTKEQQDTLAIQSKQYLNTASDVAEQNKEFTDSIPKKVKLGVYIVGDTLLGVGAITPQLVILFTTHDPFVLATTLSSALATSGLFLLTMFGIYKGGKN